MAKKAIITKKRIKNYKKIYRKAFNSFAIKTQSNSIDNMMFSFKCRDKLAKNAIFTKLTINFDKVLKQIRTCWH